MQDVPLVVFLLNIVGQLLFTSRVLVQWIASERAGRSVVPPLYWQLSLVGSLLTALYAAFRHDPVFMLAALPGCFIYARNLFIHRVARVSTLLPLGAALGVFLVWAAVEKIEMGAGFWSLLGLGGSALWASRWVLQWWISERLGRSVLPASFFIVSLIASTLLISYTLYKMDIVMFLAYALGPIPFVRNLMLIRRSGKAAARSG